ncbi:hypothetical protein VTN96DRAFT_5750 [Rasamsonia emersonii]
MGNFSYEIDDQTIQSTLQSTTALSLSGHQPGIAELDGAFLNDGKCYCICLLKICSSLQERRTRNPRTGPIATLWNGYNRGLLLSRSYAIVIY